MSKHLYHIAVSLLLIASLKASAQQVPFSRGINLTNWFQAANAQQIQLSKYSYQDFQNIKSLGCDVIRLPINLHAFTSGSPDYRLEPLFLEFLDQAVDLAEDLQMYLILDNHTFDPAVGTDPNIGFILELVWTQMAEHFKDRSQYLIYEVLNEPHDISDQAWNNIQMGVVDAIRSVDQQHYIVIGPAGWNSFHNLQFMPVYPQDKLIYTFHFYDPFVFTHQGASWTSPSMAPLADVPFPYDASSMPEFPSSLVGTWIESAFNDYHNSGTVSDVQSMIDIALQFREDRNVPIYCGEFGAYIPNSHQADRVTYYETVRQYLEDQNIAWTSWDYHGGFGLFEAGSSGLFNHHLNVPLLEALAMNAPAQTPFEIQPETTGFALYTDQIADRILESSSGNSRISYYSLDSPNNGKYCLKWEGAAQFQHVGLNFSPDKDLGELVDQGHALDFLFRGSQPFAYDIRFLDTDTGADDHPWRMRYTINEQIVPFDGRWHHLHIPLSEFSEHGAWEGQWFPPEGKFDWTNIDRLEIVAEHGDMGSSRVWIDNLYVTNQDTAQVHETSVFEDLVTSVDQSSFDQNISIYPNPAYNQLIIKLPAATVSPIHGSTKRAQFTLMDGTGRVVKLGDFKNDASIDLSTVGAGIYFLKVFDERGNLKTEKILKY